MRKSLLIATLVGLCVIGLSACNRDENKTSNDNTQATAMNAPEQQPAADANQAQVADNAAAQNADNNNNAAQASANDNNAAQFSDNSRAQDAPADNNNNQVTADASNSNAVDANNSAPASNQ